MREVDEAFMHPIFLESRLLGGKNFTNAERRADTIRDDRCAPSSSCAASLTRGAVCARPTPGLL